MKYILNNCIKVAVGIALAYLYFRVGRYIINSLDFTMEVLTVISYIFFASYIIVIPLIIIIVDKIKE